MTKHKANWLKRDIHCWGPRMVLCLDEAAFKQALQDLKSPEQPQFISGGAAMCVHHFELKGGGERSCVVCVAPGWDQYNPISLATMLVHEAVHIWQGHCEDIGERNPGKEQEAYGIQWISHTLMEEFVRQTQKGKRRA